MKLSEWLEVPEQELIDRAPERAASAGHDFHVAPDCVEWRDRVAEAFDLYNAMIIRVAGPPGPGDAAR